MQKRLFITEKSTVAKNIAEALGGEQIKGNGFITVGNDTITWCLGNFDDNDSQIKKQLEQKTFILPEERKLFDNLLLTYFQERIKAKDSHVQKILSLVDQANLIINACDPDIFGEQLVQLLLKEKSIFSCKRIYLTDLSAEAIKNALNTIKTISFDEHHISIHLGKVKD